MADRSREIRTTVILIVLYALCVVGVEAWSQGEEIPLDPSPICKPGCWPIIITTNPPSVECQCPEDHDQPALTEGQDITWDSTDWAIQPLWEPKEWADSTEEEREAVSAEIMYCAPDILGDDDDGCVLTYLAKYKCFRCVK